MKLYHSHPPIPTNNKFYNQTVSDSVTHEELNLLRKFPKYNLIQKIIQIIYFLIFGIIRIIIVLPYLLISSIIFMIMCIIWRSLGKPKSGRSFLQTFYSTMTRIFLFLIGFIKINFHGGPDPDARIRVTNHICFLDGWLLLAFSPRPLAKKELFSVPFVSDMLDVFDGIPVDRSKNSGVAKRLIECALDSSSPAVTLAPEGATTSGDYMFKFHLGAFLSDLPVQPIAIRYNLWFTSRKIAHLSFFHHSFWHFFVFLGIPFVTVDVTFFEPMSIKSHGENDPKKFADIVQLRIANFLGVRAIDKTNRSLFEEKKKTDE